MRIAVLVLLGLGAVLRAQAAELVAGPMAGPAAMREAVVWLQADAAADASIEFRGADGKRRETASLRLDAAEAYAAALHLQDLQPGQRYTYQVRLDGRPAGKPAQLATQALWQWRGDAPDFTVLAGSCAYLNDPIYDRPGLTYGGSTAIFAAMAALQPELTLWLGDNLYLREADFSPWGMAERYRLTRALPELQPLLATGQHAAIWDDHDYGPNDANSSWIHKGVSLRLFRRYWPNPSYGLPETPGVFTVVSQGDADFFLLDDRWYRDADRMPDEQRKSMLGPAQLRWLQNALLNSTAAFKIVANGSQMLNERNRKEGWNRFAAERDGFLSWLAKSGISGVLFLSGDQHHTELLKLERPGLYALYELTCSPLTAGPHDRVDDTPARVAGTYVGERNFCALEFRGARAERTLHIKTYAADGRLLWQQALRQRELMTLRSR